MDRRCRSRRVGAFSAVASWSILRHRESKTVKLPIDGVGLALLVIGYTLYRNVLPYPTGAAALREIGPDSALFIAAPDGTVVTTY